MDWLGENGDAATRRSRDKDWVGYGARILRGQETAEYERAHSRRSRRPRRKRTKAELLALAIERGSC